MRRKIFATAVVLVTIATPLFAAQEQAAQPAGSAKPQPSGATAKQPAPANATQAPVLPSAKQQPAQSSAKAQPTPAAKPQPAPATANQPASATAKQAPALPAAKPQPAAVSAQKSAAPQPSPAANATAAKAGAEAAKSPVPVKGTGKPPAAPKAPTVRLNPVVQATSKPLPNKAVVASSANAVPSGASKASVTSLSPVQLKVQSSKTLITALQPKLAGVDVVTAADGFKDLPQFVSAVHASHNLGLRFDALKTKLLTGKHANLRQAIQELRPAVSAAIESQRAQYDADGTIRAAEHTDAEAAAAAQAKLKPVPTAKPKPPQQ